jgi:hypothetical protein
MTYGTGLPRPVNGVTTDFACKGMYRFPHLPVIIRFRRGRNARPTLAQISFRWATGNLSGYTAVPDGVYTSLSGDFAPPIVVARKIRSSEFEAQISELYDNAGGNPALPVLGLVTEFSHKPICLHQAKSDPFPKPDI